MSTRRRFSRRVRWFAVVSLALLHPGAASAASAPAKPASARTPAPRTVVAPADTTPALKGGQDATVFRSLTIQGEDRIRLDFERPELKLDLDPEQAPGLEWGNARDVLDRTMPDWKTPLVAQSARELSPQLARPWLDHFASGVVARFRPAVEGVARWKLTVANSRGEALAAYQGQGDPPREIAWDGRSPKGGLVMPGLTYSHVFEAVDRAGNKRNFVGQPFEVSAYRLDTPEGPVLVFTGEALAGNATPPIVLEAASWLNQSPRVAQPVRIAATARTFDSASALGATVSRGLVEALLGDPARIQVVTEVVPDAPEHGTVRITLGR